MSQTLLLADDSVTIQRVIELTFADEDVRVVAVSDGDQAIARLTSDPPDVVLADVGMPGRNGYEVAEFIKTSPELAHIPVLLLTGAFEPIDEDRAKAAGCDGVLAKPFEPQMVIGRVRELLARSTAARAVATIPAAESAALVESISPIELPSRFLVPPIAPSRAPVAPAPPMPSPAGEDYFDRLDAAFASLNQSAPTWPRPEPEAEPALEPEPERAVGARPGAPSAVPSLPDAFATLLDAERSGTALPASWPAAAAGDLSEQAIERIVERVLARMSDRVVRETVTSVVSEVTERLIREEIQRIRDQVK